MQFFVASVIFIAAAFVSFVFGATKDEIKRLPGLKFDINFKHYSGYLKVSKTHFLHYWFVESQNDPANDPLIFWYNGGPGCSSVEGLLHEMGPYEINPDGKTLHKNPNSWNKFASVVYIEAPAGVGYSYSTDGNTQTNDDLTCEENYEGIKQFFKKYQNFRNHSTFIMGESYGGIYVPMLTAQIVLNQTDFPINLAGMAIGNGILNAKINRETQLKYLYNHGFIDELDWTEFEQKCCNGCVDTCNIDSMAPNCYNVIPDFTIVNPYNIYGTCDSGTKTVNLREAIILNQNSLLTSNFVKRSFKDEKDSGIPCLNMSDITTYMNLQNVRKALHIPSNLSKWDICSAIQYFPQYRDTTQFFKIIHRARVPILLYYGDADIMCNFMMGQQFSAQLGFPIIEHSKAWKVNGQTAGFRTLYEGLTFTTILGAGHMAPQWRAPQTTHAIKQFVSQQPL